MALQKIMKYLALLLCISVALSQAELPHPILGQHQQYQPTPSVVQILNPTEQHPHSEVMPGSDPTIIPEQPGNADHPRPERPERHRKGHNQEENSQEFKRDHHQKGGNDHDRRPRPEGRPEHSGPQQRQHPRPDRQQMPGQDENRPHPGPMVGQDEKSRGPHNRPQHRPDRQPMPGQDENSWTPENRPERPDHENRRERPGRQEHQKREERHEKRGENREHHKRMPTPEEMIPTENRVVPTPQTVPQPAALNFAMDYQMRPEHPQEWNVEVNEDAQGMDDDEEPRPRKKHCRWGKVILPISLVVGLICLVKCCKRCKRNCRARREMMQRRMFEQAQQPQIVPVQRSLPEQLAFHRYEAQRIEAILQQQQQQQHHQYMMEPSMEPVYGRPVNRMSL